MGVTKESLIGDRENAQVALLKLKQKYNASSKSIYLIVEGKDDIAYYTCMFIRYFASSCFEIIEANNRKNVINTYKSIDWRIYSGDRVFFFVDRDLSEITGEETPESKNIYVTDCYSIENSLFDERLLITVLGIFYGLRELEETEIQQITELFNNARVAHEQAFLKIMCWIVYWRMNNLKCNLSNLKSNDLFNVQQGIVSLKTEYQNSVVLGQRIHSECGVAFEDIDLTPYERLVEDHGGIRKCIRGKYVRTLFVKFLTSITQTLPDILANRKAKAIVNIGEANALQLLSGYMDTPSSLDQFLKRIARNIKEKPAIDS